jgi:hypothetical protein
MLYLRRAAGSTLWQGSSKPTRKDLKISTEGVSAGAGPVPEADAGTAVADDWPFIELCADGTAVKALEKVLLVIFPLEEMFELFEVAEFGGSLALGGVFVGAGREDLTSS